MDPARIQLLKLALPGSGRLSFARLGMSVQPLDSQLCGLVLMYLWSDIESGCKWS